jgi:DNA polymerase I-like protein with 3'-5' exonuclease and polymerase domains
MSFDYKMLKNHYGVVKPDMHCTAIMARCVFHATYPDDRRADLAAVCKALFKEELIKKAGATDWGVPTLTFEQIEYAAKDAIVQMRVFEKLNDYVDKLKLRPVYDLYRKAQIVIADMELNGISFNKDQHLKNVVKWREELLDALTEVKQLTGLNEITDSKLGVWLEENLSEGMRIVWPRSELTGKLKTDANTFVYYSDLEIVKPFSRYQKLKKLTTSFGMNLHKFINPKTDKMHPGYRLAGAKTGRLSCNEPNIQQSPRDKDFRSMFVPSPGYVFVVADYSQVEVRCIAELSNDPEMLKAYAEGLDIYSYTASKMSGIAYEVINSKDENGNKHPLRQQAKALVLGLNYGLGAKKFSHYAKKGYDVSMSQAESHAAVIGYRELYSTLREWQLEQVNHCPLRKYTAFSVLGKTRKMTEDDYYGACMNHPVQGSCAEIMLLALVYAARNVEGTSARLLASVHDEIILECLAAFASFSLAYVF